MTKILRPPLPFQTAIFGGIYDGKVIEIKGRVPYGENRFEINLMTGFDHSTDKALHLGIRFDQNCVVRNHQEYGHWGPEERHGPFPFSFGRDFKMLIVVDRAEYRIAVDNRHCWNFTHRMAMDRVKSFGMYGSVSVHEIEFIDRPNQVTSVRPSLAPVYNPTIPFTYPIYGGLKPGMVINISGRPSQFPNKFSINLQKGAAEYPPPDIAFHLDPRFFNRSVVRNSRTNDVWASEETHISHFPFHPGVSFDLVIRVETDRYSVFINGQHFTDFRHRLKPLKKFDTLYIYNDVSISSIRFS